MTAVKMERKKNMERYRWPLYLGWLLNENGDCRRCEGLFYKETTRLVAKTHLCKRPADWMCPAYALRRDNIGPQKTCLQVM